MRNALASAWQEASRTRRSGLVTPKKFSGRPRREKKRVRKDGGVRIAGKTDLNAFLLKVQCAAEC